MKVLILFFLYITVTCQAHQRLHGRLVARQGDEQSELYMNNQLYEKFKILADNYMKIMEDVGDPNIVTLLVPDFFKRFDEVQSRRQQLQKKLSGPYINSDVTKPFIYPPIPIYYEQPHVKKRLQQNFNGSPYRFTKPAIHGRFHVNNADQIQQTAQAEQKPQYLQESEAERKSRFAQIDKEALSKLSKDNRQIIESRLSVAEREALLTQLEDGQLDDMFPREENRFGDIGASTGGFAGAIAELSASAGGYIGGKLAGSLGAKLGAAAGAYLGAAAASHFVKKSESSQNQSNKKITDSSKQSGPASFGAVLVNKK